MPGPSFRPFLGRDRDGDAACSASCSGVAARGRRHRTHPDAASAGCRRRARSTSRPTRPTRPATSRTCRIRATPKLLLTVARGSCSSPASCSRPAGSRRAPAVVKRRGRRGPRRAGCAGRARRPRRASPGPRREPADGPAGEPVIHAKDVAFVESTITAPADVPFTLEFVNEDAGIPHNVEIKDGGGTSVFKGEIFPGVETRVYDVPALARRDVHVRLHRPPEHDRDRDPPVGRVAEGTPSRRVDRSSSPWPSPSLTTVGRLVVRQRRRRRAAGRDRRQPAPPIVGTTLDGAAFDLATLSRVDRSSSTSGVRRASPVGTSSRSSSHELDEHAADGLAIVGVLTDDPTGARPRVRGRVRRDVADRRGPGRGDQARLSRRGPAADLVRRSSGRHPVACRSAAR